MPYKFFSIVSVTLLLCALPGLATKGWGEEAAEPELMIVKYGSLSVRSSVPGAKVYIDDVYKGAADTVIEDITAGDHMISCRTEDKAVTGLFQIRKNETLRLEARFNEGKLAVFKEREPSKAEVEKQKPEPVKAEAEKKKPEPVKQEKKPKKPVAEPKKVEQKNPVEERRKNHLTVMKIQFEISDTQKIQIAHSGVPSIGKYTEKKDHTGKYYRTKQGILLCDAGPCDLIWSVSFTYNDETGKSDALLLNWKETVFNGITPAGTSKRELECCLNGHCSKVQTADADMDKEFEMGRYRLSWMNRKVAVRRADIMKEVLDAGRSVDDY